jgi:hypothetical protein
MLPDRVAECLRDLASAALTTDDTARIPSTSAVDQPAHFIGAAAHRLSSRFSKERRSSISACAFFTSVSE